MLYVDPRWDGNFGIGRYSREVLSRLEVAHTILPISDPPASPLSAIKPRRLTATASDVIYSPGFTPIRSAARQVLTVYDLIHLEGAGRLSSRTLFYENIIKPSILRNGLVFTCSDESADVIRDWLQTDHVDVVVARTGISDAFAQTGDAFSATRPYVAYVGNFKPHKNVRVAFDALGRLPDLDFVVVSSDREQAKALGEEFGLSDRLTILSNIDDAVLASVYSGALVTVMPSLAEGFGLPAAESIASGTPVIYWSGCAPIAGTVGRSGVGTASATDAAEWARAIRTASSSPEIASSVGGFRPSTWDDAARTIEKTLLDYMSR